MRFWVELKDHVANGQTVTSLLRFNTFNQNKLKTNQCLVAKVWQPLQYICKSYHSKVIEGELPCQAVVININVDETPTQLASIKQLEQVLIDSQFLIPRAS